MLLVLKEFQVYGSERKHMELFLECQCNSRRGGWAVREGFLPRWNFEAGLGCPRFEDLAWRSWHTDCPDMLGCPHLGACTWPPSTCKAATWLPGQLSLPDLTSKFFPF